MKSNLAKLLSQIEAFYKAAGLVKVPPELLKEVQDWAFGYYCGKFVDKLDETISKNRHTYTPTKTVNILNARNRLNKLSLDENGKKYPPVKRFTVPVNTVSYFPNANNIVRFYGQFIDKPSENSAMGGWDSSKGILYIYHDIDHDLKKDNMYIGTANRAEIDIKTTVKHELVHVIQTIIGINLDEIGGLPSKNIRKNDVDLYGYDFLNRRDVSHEERDIEFYPRLSDTVTEFPLYSKFFPKPLHSDLAKVWIHEISLDEMVNRVDQYLKQGNYNNEQIERLWTVLESIPRHNNYMFFYRLKMNQPEKYQKAVKEFHKAIGL